MNGRRSMGTKTRAGCVVTIALAGMLTLSGQQGAFQAPSSGYVFDGYAKAIRPVVGYVGSAYLGAPVAAADWATVSPNGRSAWIWQEGRMRFLPSLASGEGVDWTETKQPTQAMWSGDGAKCMLAGPGGVAVVSRDESGAPRLEREFAPPAESAVRLLAASADLETAVLAVRSGESSPWSVLLWQAAGEPRELMESPDPSAAIFFGAQTLFVADAVNKHIVRISLDSEAGAEPVLTSEEGIESPCALLKGAGESLIVVERDARTVRRYALDSRTVDREEMLDDQPGLLSVLGANRYLLNQRTRKQQVLLILDVSGDPKVSFVPAGE